MGHGIQRPDRGGQGPLLALVQRAAQMGGDGLFRTRLQPQFGIAPQQPGDGLARFALMAFDPVAAPRGQVAIKLVTFLHHIAPVGHIAQGGGGNGVKRHGKPPNGFLPR